MLQSNSCIKKCCIIIKLFAGKKAYRSNYSPGKKHIDPIIRREKLHLVYMRDTGLLMPMLEEGSQEDIINGNLGIYKGAIFENIVADIFGKSCKKLYYFEYNSKIEIDFFIRCNMQAAAVEVKSADNTKTKSMTSVIENYGVKHGIKLSMKNVGGNDIVDSFPLYMAMFL